MAKTGGVCFSDPEQLFKQQGQLEFVYECEVAGNSELCTTATNSQCHKFNVKIGVKYLDSQPSILAPQSEDEISRNASHHSRSTLRYASNTISNQASKDSNQTSKASHQAPNKAFNKPSTSGIKASNSFQQQNSPRKQLLAAYLSAMNYKESLIIMDPQFSIQTGKYPQFNVSPQALNSKCMTTIVQAAYKLHSYFPNYSFVIDSHIQNCNNLRDGIKRLIASQKRVKSNLDKFNSPLHSVYLSNQTRFVHRELGKIGLHINVNQVGEIQKRLIEFEIGAIPTDDPNTHLTGLLK